MKEQIIFSPQGGIDTDSDLRAIVKGDYPMFDYCRLGQTTGAGFSVVTSRGTLLIDNPFVGPLDTIIGTGVWQKEYAIVYLVLKENGDNEIWAYRVDTQSHLFICLTTAFNWSADWPVYHCDIIDNIATFTDGRWDDAQYENNGTRLFNPPYQIDLRKALDGDYPVIDLQVVDAIKWPPKPPVCVYSTDQTRADNKLRRKLFRFRIRYIYENSQESVWSLWSNLAIPSESEFIDGTNWPDSSQDNLLVLTFNTGPNVVKKIEVCVSQYDDLSGGAENQFGLFLQIDKLAEGVADNSTYTYNFYGNVSTKPVTNLDKNYDRLPITAFCQSIVDNSRMTYTNIREGYDKIEVDIEVERLLTEIVQQTKAATYTRDITSSVYTDFKIVSSDTGFRFAVGDAIVMTLIPTSSGGFDAINLLHYITQDDIDFALIQVTEPLQIVSLLFRVAQAYADQLNDFFDVTVFQGAVISSEAQVITTGPIVSPTYPSFVGFTGTDQTLTVTQKQTLSTPSLKTGASHRFGIIHGDRAFRDDTVTTNDNLVLFVPFYTDETLTADFSDPNNPYTVLSRFLINNVPPIQAEHYWFVAQEATEISDFSQWIVNSAFNQPAFNTVPNDGRYKISLDKFYLDKYKGVTINHTPQKGDIVRFIRQRVENIDNPPTAPYLTTYFELEVQEYDPIGGVDGRASIIVERFNLSILDPTVYTGQMVEIYTPRPSLDADGRIFSAPWRDISEALPILNPHTEDRVYGGSTITGTVETTSGSDDYTFLNGDYEFLLGRVVTIDLSTTPVTGTVTQVSYDNITNTTAVEILGEPSDVTETTTWSSTLNQAAGIPAIYYSNYGDVYVRQRNYATGYNAPFQNGYWFIEDPHYSDYWLSDVHQVGRIELESSTAKLTNRIATSIHSDVYLQNNQINGLGSFSLFNDNIQDMNPVYGEVIRTYLSGTERKTLKCIQPRKENSIYIQFYPQNVEEEGNLVINKSQTFSAYFAYKSIWGCSRTGATALDNNAYTYYFDELNGVFVMSSTNGQTIISERDPKTGRDFKFRTKTKQLAEKVRTDPTCYIRTYIDQQESEVGFCFAFTNVESPTGYDYEIYTFDTIGMRWRTRYDYNFVWFENFGQTLIGFGANTAFYLHNQADSYSFHGDTFIQKLTVVSNENPLNMKRYQDFLTRGNKTFSVYAYALPNQSYGQMATSMSKNLFSVYEGYSLVAYNKNRFDPAFATQELAEMNGEDVRANALVHELSYNPTEENSASILFDVEIDFILS